MDKITFQNTLRLILVVFFLYLIGDIFYRWDGASYYITFSEFIPAIALISLLWSLVALFTALIIYLSLKGCEWFCSRTGWNFNTNYLLIFVSFFILLFSIAWSINRLDRQHVMPSLVWRIVLIVNLLVSILITWWFRRRTNILFEGIRPLVGLSLVIILLSIPLVAFNALRETTDDHIRQEVHAFTDTNDARPNILLITYDALTARDMSLYGYDRLTTPFITEWAQEASVFTRAKASSNLTASTVPSLLTGKNVWSHRVFNPLGDRIHKGNIETLPLLLKKWGYYTAAYNANVRCTPKRLGISNSFNINYSTNVFNTKKTFLVVVDNALLQLFFNKIKLYDWFTQEDFLLKKYVSYIYYLPGIGGHDDSATYHPPDIAFNLFLKDVANMPEPFFVWIHHYPPHNPYLPPKPFVGMFDPSSKFRNLKSQSNANDMFHVLNRSLKIESKRPDLKTALTILRARYDEFIRYCDKQFEEFIMQAEKKNILDNTIVVLSSDHGEMFEQHMKHGHGGLYLYEELTHIPLIIKEPGKGKGRIINDIVRQIDIPATVVDIANIPLPTWMEGRSLKPLMKGETLQPVTVFSMNLENSPSLEKNLTKGVIALWEGDYKLIHYLGPKVPFNDTSKSLLFNLKEDPDEIRNIYDIEPERAEHLLNIILDNVNNHYDNGRIMQ